MSHTESSAPSSTAAGFAGLLSALISPRPAAKPASDEPAWNDEDLAQDVATLSYESALRNHARYTSAAQDKTSYGEISDAEGDFDEEIPEEVAAFAEKLPGAPESAVAVPMAARDADVEAESAPHVSRPIVHKLKKASITIRLSEPECEQLHQRAEEAGMTVSAYLRSCTFEAEALRSQVKEALVQMRAAAAASVRAAQPLRHTWRDWAVFVWLRRILTPPESGPHAARA